MSSSSLNILRRYFYDPLDHLMGAGLTQAAGARRFYQDGRVATELEQDKQTTIFRQQVQPLAQRQRAGGVTDTALLMTDLAQTVMQASTMDDSWEPEFTVYGFHRRSSGLASFIGFKGECADAVTGHFPLGQGRRFYNPILMRFNSPDYLSPFDLGGPNAYAYCENDPVNFIDPSGAIKVRTPPTRRAEELVPHAPTIAKNIHFRGRGQTYVIQEPDALVSMSSTTSIPQVSHSQAIGTTRPTKDSTSFFLDHVLDPTPEGVTRTETPSEQTLYRENLRIYGKAYDKLFAAGKIKPLSNMNLLKRLEASHTGVNGFSNSGLPLDELPYAKQRLVIAQLATKRYTIRRYGLHGMLNLQDNIRKNRAKPSSK